MKIIVTLAVVQETGTRPWWKQSLIKSNRGCRCTPDSSARALYSSMGKSPSLIAFPLESVLMALRNSGCVKGSVLTSSGECIADGESVTKLAGRTLHCTCSKKSANVQTRTSLPTVSPKGFFNRVCWTCRPFRKRFSAAQSPTFASSCNQLDRSFLADALISLHSNLSNAESPSSLAKERRSMRSKCFG